MFRQMSLSTAIQKAKLFTKQHDVGVFVITHNECVDWFFDFVAEGQFHDERIPENWAIMFIQDGEIVERY